MKIVVGLGNPGPEYGGTRHNSGQLLVDRMFSVQDSIFKQTYGWRRKKDIMTAEFPELVLVKTAGVFMNESGKIISELKYMNVIPTERSERRDPSTAPSSLNLRKANGMTSHLYIAHDDLDIKLGEYKIQFGTGPKVHNGVLAVERALGTKDFWRIRIGIDNRTVPVDGETYVLQRFTNDEKQVLDEVLKKAAEEILK